MSRRVVAAVIAVSWVVLAGGADAAVPRVGNGESADAAISWDGRFVAFGSSASDLVPGDSNGFFDAFVRDRQLGLTERVSVGLDGTQANGGTEPAAITPDGVTSS